MPLTQRSGVSGVLIDHGRLAYTWRSAHQAASRAPLVRAFDGGCAVQNGICLQLLYLHSFASSPHLPLAPVAPLLAPAAHPSLSTQFLLHFAPPRLLRLEYRLAGWIASAPAPPLWAASHTRSLLALQGSPAALLLRSSSLQGTLFPASGVAPAARLLLLQDASGTRDASRPHVRVLGHPLARASRSFPASARIALVPRLRPHCARSPPHRFGFFPAHTCRLARGPARDTFTLQIDPGLHSSSPLPAQYDAALRDCTALHSPLIPHTAALSPYDFTALLANHCRPLFFFFFFGI
ncbi:hypothetical protein B0H13DRAFT_2385970 [Mycena leptocephala]|nr:hypothetical protein B0H13DRAFT_2385970 [Mycena leptocephala]